MATELFSLASDEVQLGEYFFRSSFDFGNRAIVSNRRLILAFNNEVQSIPLSKISSVKVGYSGQVWLAWLGIFFLLISLGSYFYLEHIKQASLGLLSALLQGALYSDMVDSVKNMAMIQHYLLPVFLLYAIWMVIFFRKGSTALIVSVDGEVRTYKTSGNDERLIRFVEILTHAL